MDTYKNFFIFLEEYSETSFKNIHKYFNLFSLYKLINVSKYYYENINKNEYYKNNNYLKKLLLKLNYYIDDLLKLLLDYYEYEKQYYCLNRLKRIYKKSPSKYINKDLDELNYLIDRIVDKLNEIYSEKEEIDQTKKKLEKISSKLYGDYNKNFNQ